MLKPIFTLTLDLRYCFRAYLALTLTAWSVSGSGQLLEDARGWDEKTAIEHSQAAVGKLLGNYKFTRSDGSRVSLSDGLKAATRVPIN